MSKEKITTTLIDNEIQRIKQRQDQGSLQINDIRSLEILIRTKALIQSGAVTEDVQATPKDYSKADILKALKPQDEKKKRKKSK